MVVGFGAGQAHTLAARLARGVLVVDANIHRAAGSANQATVAGSRPVDKVHIAIGGVRVLQESAAIHHVINYSTHRVKVELVKERISGAIVVLQRVGGGSEMSEQAEGRNKSRKEVHCASGYIYQGLKRIGCSLSKTSNAKRMLPTGSRVKKERRGMPPTRGEDTLKKRRENGKKRRKRTNQRKDETRGDARQEEDRIQFLYSPDA